MFLLNDQIALLTKHGKLNQIAPVFAKYWQGRIVLFDQFDTDSLGAFDNTIKRELAPFECAIQKAKLACQYTGLDQGLGSEGSFFNYLGLGTMNEECVAFVDIVNDIQIVGIHRQLTELKSLSIESEQTLYEVLGEFPTHQGWMLTNGNQQNEVIYAKGLIGADHILKASKQFPIELTPDFRAMLCPERQENIINATRNLLSRLNSPCPKCDAPGFVYDAPLMGLPCEICSSPTNQKKGDTANCSQCGYQNTKLIEKQTGSAFYCNLCNP